MRFAGSLDDYVREWRDAYVVERDFCAFHAVPDLFGVIVWGRPGIEQARLITQARSAELLDLDPHRVVLDYRLVEGIDQEAFKCIGEWVGAHREALTQRTLRVALIQPTEPFAAAIVSGFYRVVGAPYPSQLCETLEEAESWLGAPTAAAITEVRGLCAAGRRTTTALVRLLERNPGLDVDAAADQLGLTARTLQRRLRDEGTTFRAETRRALVRHAKTLLATTDDKIADIARAIGCATVQHFSDLFREEAGVPPATWRARVRGES